MLFWGPLLSFQKQKMSSKRQYKHNTLTGRQSPQVRGGMYLTWATDFLLHLHEQIPLPFPYFSSLWIQHKFWLFPNSWGTMRTLMVVHHCGHDPAEMRVSKDKVFTSAKLVDWGWFLVSWLVSTLTLTLIHPELLGSGEQWSVSRCTEVPFQQALRLCTSPA